jgi:hypothetical protein
MDSMLNFIKPLKQIISVAQNSKEIGSEEIFHSFHEARMTLIPIILD